MSDGYSVIMKNCPVLKHDYKIECLTALFLLVLNRPRNSNPACKIVLPISPPRNGIPGTNPTAAYHKKSWRKKKPSHLLCCKDSSSYSSNNRMHSSLINNIAQESNNKGSDKTFKTKKKTCRRTSKYQEPQDLQVPKILHLVHSVAIWKLLISFRLSC